MYDDFEDGIKAAILGILTGLVTSSILVVIKELGPTYASYGTLFELVNLVGSILVITKFKHIGSGYLAGYILGFGILSYVGLVETWLFILYAVVGVPIIVSRFTEKVQDILDGL
jgi:hypothetical protein